VAWEVQLRNGVWLPQVGWWLDAHFPARRSFVSHAHFDHMAAHRVTLCSEGTARLMAARLPPSGEVIALPFDQPHPLEAGAVLTLHPAGHVFGSAQALIEHPQHGRLLYTGDFKLRPGLSAEPCATPRADTLVMETTYGRPHYVLPPTARVLADIVRFCRDALENEEVPVLFGYSLGKSQEILRGLADAGLPVMLHPQVHKLTLVYGELGIAFPPFSHFEHRHAAGHVVIAPPQSSQSAWLRKIPARRTAAITGWAMDPGAIHRYQCDAIFPLSDHADYADLLAFVERVGPQVVYTLHGFAQDFARTLRDRGIEAWALGENNQLELGLDPAPAPVAAVPPPPPLSSEPAHLPPGTFAAFAALADRVRATASRHDKVAVLAGHLRELAPEEAGCAALFFTGRPFSQASGRSPGVGWSAIKRAVLAVAGLTEADYRATYSRFADSGETAEALLAGRTSPAPAPLVQIAALFAGLAADDGPLAKTHRLESVFAGLTAREAKYLVKILLGDLRIGLKEGLVEEAIALAAGVPTEAVRDAHLLCGDIARVATAARRGTLDAIEVAVLHPLQFMLASPEPSAEAIVERLGWDVWLEEKFDGIRCQLHKCGDRVELFSRDLRKMTAQFPDLVAAARRLPADVIADGELLAWRDDSPLPFAELQKRLGREGDDFFLGVDIPVSFTAYDLLWHNGRPVLRAPLAERRALLEQVWSEADATSLRLAPVHRAQGAEEIDAAFHRARARGHEGLIAKDPASPYTPGRRGLAWLKLKRAYATLDVVVVAVEYGHGKRRGLLSDYTFAVRDDAQPDRLLTVGKAYTGLTNDEIAHLTAHFLERTVEVRGRLRHVQPDIVLEVAFDLIRPSTRHNSGFALRFPRIVRLRPDKTVREIDTLATCRRLAHRAAGNPGSTAAAA
jgi:DNA ligase-1